MTKNAGTGLCVSINRLLPQVIRALPPVVRRFSGDTFRLFLRAARITTMQKMIHGHPVLLPVRHYSIGSFFNLRGLNNYEGDYFDAVIGCIRPGDRVFEIGAYKGIYTVCLARETGEHGKVVAFEPHPVNARILMDTIEANNLENVIVVEEAAGRNTGQSEFYLRGSGSSLNVSEGRDEQVEVNLTTVDSFVSRTNHVPDILKLDVEGFELDVLEGAKTALSNCRYLCCEVHPGKMRAIGQEPKQLLDFTAARGFREIHRFVPPKHMKDRDRPYYLVLEKMVLAGGASHK